jgi:hypothetical protein
VKSEDKPLVVYHADCAGRQFERGPLGTPRSRRFGLCLAVMINRTRAARRHLARYYGVDGYPTFFVTADGAAAGAGGRMP